MNHNDLGYVRLAFIFPSSTEKEILLPFLEPSSTGKRPDPLSAGVRFEYMGLWKGGQRCNGSRAKGLLAQDLKTPLMDGEAFNITDGERHRFLGLSKNYLEGPGHEVKDEKLWILPTWLALIIVDMLERLFWLLTLRTRRPKLLGRQQVEHSCFSHTYRIDKAREKLGCNPKATFEEVRRRSTQGCGMAIGGRWLEV